ncbi:hypothetical protein KI387_006150, partial [Taxus chinensis]
MDANRPVRPKSAQGALGHPGQRDAWDADRRRSRKPMRSCHVSSQEKGPKSQR